MSGPSPSPGATSWPSPAGRALVVSAKPQFTVLTAGGLARAVAAAVVMALVAAALRPHRV